MVVQVAAIAARRAALAAARAKARAQAKARGEKSLAREVKGVEKRESDISWFEVIFVLIFFALPNDLIDMLEITIVGKFITLVVDVITALTIFIWFWIRVGESPNRKLAKFLIATIAEMFPAIGILPMWTLLALDTKLRLIEKLLSFIMQPTSHK